MPGSVIPVTGLILGPVGSISQTDFPLISPRLLNISDTLNLGYGDPFILNPNNTYSSIPTFIAASGVLASNTPIGIAKDDVRTNPYYPIGGGTAMPAGVYVPGIEVNGLTRGTINCAITNGTPAGAQSPAFIRTVLNTGVAPNSVIGSWEASPDGTLAAVALAGNTGNTTLGTLSLGATPVAGVYRVSYTDATHFNVFSPNGDYLGSGVNGTAFTSTGINFTATTGGTAMVRGDGFTVTTTMKNTLITNVVFKTGILSTDASSGQITAQLTLLERKMA